jgi:hypothetical protein
MNKNFINKISHNDNNNFKDCVISLHNLENNLNISEFQEINKNQNNDFQLMFDICKSKIKQLKHFIKEFELKKNTILHHYKKLTEQTEKLWILIGLQELINFLKNMTDDEIKLNDILNKFPFLSLKIVGKDWKNEFFDLYLYLFHNNHYKKCITLMKNKGLHHNILTNSNAYKNIFNKIYSLNSIVSESVYVDKMKSLIFEVDNEELTKYLTNIYKSNIDITLSCQKYKIEDVKKSNFWLAFIDDVKNISKEISCVNVGVLNDFDFFNELYFCSKFISVYNNLNKLQNYVTTLDNILENKYHEFMNTQSYTIYIRNGINSILSCLNSPNFDVNKLDDLREKFPELFRDYVLIKPVILQRLNTVDFWSISCFINKKYCSDHWKNNNKLNYKVLINKVFEDKLNTYFNYKLKVIDDINTILEYDNSIDKISIEFNNLIFSFTYGIDDDKLNRLIEAIKIHS